MTSNPNPEVCSSTLERIQRVGGVEVGRRVDHCGKHEGHVDRHQGRGMPVTWENNTVNPVVSSTENP